MHGDMLAWYNRNMNNTPTPYTGETRETTTMPHGTYERIMAANTKDMLGTVIHDLLSDHYPETYYGKNGKQYKYCPTCNTTNEDGYVDYTDNNQPLHEGCSVMQVIVDNDLENY